MSRIKAGPGRGRKTIFAPPLSVDSTKDEIRAALINLIQAFPPRSKVKVKGLEGIHFVLCPATEKDPITPILTLGCPYKRGRIFLTSSASIKYYRDNLNHPFGDLCLEVMAELFPHLNKFDDPNYNRDSALVQRILARGMTIDITYSPEKSKEETSSTLENQP